MGIGKKIRYLGRAALLWTVMANTSLAEQVTVFAASSLKETLEEITASFEAASGHSVTLSFAGSSALARQIEYGAPADLFVSASTDWMDHLEAQGRIKPQTRRNLVGNRLVLIGKAGTALQLTVSPDLDLRGALDGGRLAMALTEAVPAGIYGKAALQSLGLWDQVADAVAQTDNVRAAMALVALGATPLGIVYATDARADPAVATVGVFPEETHPAIRYPAAQLAASENAAAVALLDYLDSPAADEVFRRDGFILIGD